MEFKNIFLPLTKTAVYEFSAGDYVLLNGDFYTARDAAHKRIDEALKCSKALNHTSYSVKTIDGEMLPFDGFDSLSKDIMPINLENATIYYVGPCFDKNGDPSSAGPTTGMRMDAYAPLLYDAGVIATIGKGDRNLEVYNAIKRNGAVYFAAIGGAGATYAKAVTKSETVAYSDLGTEAIYKFSVKDFPVIVAIDYRGNSIFKPII